MECHGRSATIIPWSIRQTAIYQRHQTCSATSDCILIQAPDSIQRRFFELVEDGSMAHFINHWTSLHEVYFGSITQNWAAYIKLLDTKIDEIVRPQGLLKLSIMLASYANYAYRDSKSNSRKLEKTNRTE